MSGVRLIVVVAALLAALPVSGCGSDDSDASDARTRTATTETRDDDDSEQEPTPGPETVPEGELPPIQVTAPTAFETLVGVFLLEGTAQVSEGTLAWALLDARLKPMVGGRLTASCGAPCRGEFRTRIGLAKVPVGSWELHVWSPNQSDDGPARLHDTMVPVTVADRRVAGAPEPGALPPGGAPPG